MGKKVKAALLGCCIATLTLQSGLALASSDDEGKIKKLEKQMQTLLVDLQNKQSSIDAVNRQVTSLVSKMDKVIADKLSISVRTVEGHFNSIFTKLNVSSRIEAVLYAVSRKLVTLEEESKT